MKRWLCIVRRGARGRIALRRNARGFTLLEVVVAMTIMTVGVLGMAGFSASVSQTNRGSANRTRADQALLKKVEQLQSQAYGTISSGADTVEVGDVNMARTWVVTDNTPETGLKRVVLTAVWRERGRTFGTRTATLLGKY
ncbi:MAG: prepilin-type N-terminal cleavage/methylation domain-containing protein [Gemmatimonadota bacterium]